MSNYAVISSILREEIKPFAGCWKIIKQTDSTVWVERVKSKGETEEQRYPKSRVMFYSKRDVSSSLEIFNELVKQSLHKHKELVAHVVNLVKLESEKP